MDKIIINIAKQFSDAPGGRFIIEGPFSGEDFRNKFLVQHFEKSTDNYPIEILLDGTFGFAPSFLEEAFGGLARKFGKDRVQKRLIFISAENSKLIPEILSYVDRAQE